MLQIEIDGKQIAVKQGATVMEAAHELGTYIPHFCYHKKLSIAANCRMCLVEVEKAPKPLPACATPVTDGMVVHTHSPKAKQAQEGVMEFLLINHPLDCPICDQGGECQLQDLAVGYGKSSSRYQEEKRSVVGKDMGPLVSAEEMSRCIHCTRCVRFTEEIAGMQEIAMANRGEFSEIMPFIGKAVETELSGNVIDLCPVGALTSKPFRYDARSWELSRRKTISAHDALGSNLIVQTKEHTVRRVLPLENEAVNECWISDRDRFAYEGLYHESRLKTPKIKHGGEWHEVDWPTALEYVRKTLDCIAKEDGKEQIGIWANPMNTVEELYLAKKLANGLGIKHFDTRLQQQDNRLTGRLKGAQWLGQSIEDLGNSDAVLVVGANLRKEQPLLTARLRRAAKSYMALSIIAGSKEELHMPLLAQEAVHPNEWAGRLKNLAQDLEQGVAASLKNAEKAAIVLGAEVQNHPDYAAVYAAAQELAAATGAVLGILPQAANSVGADILGVNSGNSIQEMLAQPKKAVLLLNVEPEIDVANGGKAVAVLKQAQSVMAFTPFESETLREVCDVMLPIAPFTETSGSFISMEGRVQSFHGVVKGFADSRPLWKVLRVLGNVFELEGFEFDSSEQVLKEAVNKEGLSEKLNNAADIQVQANQAAGQLVRVGGVGIYHTDPIVRRSAPLQATSHAQVPAARLHPNTLAALGLQDGASAQAGQGAERIRVTVVADAGLSENVVYLPLHTENAALGALMNTIELAGA
ncbi:MULTISPECIES: NADH-quinone oxidoreductase subunit NuoG [unclassified Neisseria]|uniref:NADH-quinone oxidoreductase subunit NuoG n=1 Tax=unclassified Neisseria TaxID=2623750 RepID=UPI002665DCCF|nr:MULTISPECIES: NADH-quinone oxidoreductase subunit NuoG [unclassified Neisseria]MDO1510682.1 NADH-quinone oxidoreductase subunit NuoG [Neisseria sp. MVDL19-042950]MDO1516972.1 NADH-quinone oxidoreductase subunit NuoG [Neisseria sp. MVDL18-041461]MDO1564334.1 NADH-quinone oxidoreductase subunit NuoG [Neisseria sp. MVDL20-010259]